MTKFLFQFGFICPILWLVAGLTLLLPSSNNAQSLYYYASLSPSPLSLSDHELGLTPEEQEEEFNLIQEEHVEWARRSLAAFVAFGLLVGTLIAFGMMISTRLAASTAGGPGDYSGTR